MAPHRFHQKTGWFIPGLAFKRWILLAIVGVVLLAIGLALLLNLQPVTAVIRVLQQAALVIPASVSGPVLLIVGLALLYFGISRTSKTFYTAMGGEPANLLEALYRRHKLAQGPRIVAIGGGTGLSTLLRGVKHYTSNITAVVTVGDDGGSSGRLRKEQGIIPPGDIRNCIAALADEERLITELFQYRFKNGMGLEGHSFGNLFLTALCNITGDMMSAIKESSKVLNIRGRVLPSTLDSVALGAEMADGQVVMGESDIPEAHGQIKRLFCAPEDPKPLPEVLKAIEEAELIILGPGSLYTSVIPNLLIKEIAAGLEKTQAPKVYVANIVTQPGETDDYTVSDHLRAIESHAGAEGLLDAVFINSWLPEALKERYEKTGSYAVKLDEERIAGMDVEVVEAVLVDEHEENTLRHNPDKLARTILGWFKKARKKMEQAGGNVVNLGKDEQSPADKSMLNA